MLRLHKVSLQSPAGALIDIDCERPEKGELTVDHDPSRKKWVVRDGSVEPHEGIDNRGKKFTVARVMLIVPDSWAVLHQWSEDGEQKKPSVATDKVVSLNS